MGSGGITELHIVREAQAQALLTAYTLEGGLHTSTWGMTASEFASGKAILNAAPAVQVAVVRAALRHRTNSWPVTHAIEILLSQLSKRSLPYTRDDVKTILQALAVDRRLPAQAMLRSLARLLANPETLADCRVDLEHLRSSAGKWYASADQRKFLRLLDEILGGQQERALVIHADEWGVQVHALLDQLDSAADHWTALLRHCVSANGSSPSGKWLTTARQLRDALGMATFAHMAAEWIGAFRKSTNKPPEYNPQTHERASVGALLDDENANMLRGLAWCCADVDDAPLAASLADAAVAGYRKITGIGPRSAKVAGACIYALKSMPGLHGAAQLERVRLSVKQPAYVKGIESALDEAARHAGLSRDDLEELTVPTFGLKQGDEGKLHVTIGSCKAELAIVGVEVTIVWHDAAGRARKAEPAEVKRDHKAALKDLKRLRDDIAHMLTAQRDRLERLPLAERCWPLPTWRERYLDHPLIGDMSRHLIWRFTTGELVVDGAWDDDKLVDVTDQPLDLPETTTVSPWHPIACDAASVLAWREWLERHQITQPFKQAHREIYPLTDAERATRVYSNRFAAHILRQHQFNALCAARGWRNQLRLMVDDSYSPATLTLPHWGMRAEFWIEGAGDEYNVDTNDTGTYLRVATDQVRFYPINAPGNSAHAGGGGYSPEYDWRTQQRLQNEPLPLEQIPPLVFSEVMRDVDLFVGVASVGNDPMWHDGGPGGRYRDYWQSYSFGDLSATAETRKQILSRLIPRLTIADRCTIDGRFLTVRGHLRTYNIHLGSGNILMEPNGQYLCIVPGRGSASPTEQLFLPFEGDTVLAIILSKALLLAEDTKISDPTITRQIGMVV